MTCRIVVMDTSVLINLAIVERIGLLATLEGLRFVIPGEVLFEVKKPEERDRVCAGIKIGALQEVVLDQPQELSLFARFRQRPGQGRPGGESLSHAIQILPGASIKIAERRGEGVCAGGPRRI